MATGISFPLQCDPTTKLETWIFQKIGTAGGGQAGAGGSKPVYRRLPYNLVSFDGDPTQYLEPAALSDFARVLDGTGIPIDPRVDGATNIVGILYCDARPFEVFCMNEVDVAGNLGQLP